MTGSLATARAVPREAPGLRLHAETSGKNSMIICPGADLDEAIRDLVRSAFGHAGQKCRRASAAILVGSLGRDRRFLARLADAVRTPSGRPGDRPGHRHGAAHRATGGCAPAGADPARPGRALAGRAAPSSPDRPRRGSGRLGSDSACAWLVVPPYRVLRSGARRGDGRQPRRGDSGAERHRVRAHGRAVLARPTTRSPTGSTGSRWATCTSTARRRAPSCAGSRSAGGRARRSGPPPRPEGRGTWPRSGDGTTTRPSRPRKRALRSRRG